MLNMIFVFTINQRAPYFKLSKIGINTLYAYAFMRKTRGPSRVTYFKVDHNILL